MILAWLVLLLLVLGIRTLLGWIDLEAIWSNQILADVAITILTVIPFWIYLVVTEAGPGPCHLG